MKRISVGGLLPVGGYEWPWPYVVLVLMGEPGAAKSSLTKLLKALIDPNKAPLRATPREARDMFVAANNAT